MKSTTYILLFFIFLLQGVFAQETTHLLPSDSVKRCGFKQANPQLTPEKLLEIETFMRLKENARKSARRSSRIENGIKILPVVVHVIHNGDAIGENENISDARVQSQITVLNQDYRKQIGTPGYNTNPVGADLEIQFELVTKDPAGNPTNGINRVNYGVSEFTTYAQVDAMKAATIWDPTRYINVWVINIAGSGTGNLVGFLGYAQFPAFSDLPGFGAEENAEPANTDGVVITWKAFGSINLVPGTYEPTYATGRTTTHEIGHYLGLLHTFNEYDLCQDNDYCADTPIEKTPNLSGCNLTRDTCPADPGYDMVQNYLDYSPDTCMNIFTQDQKSRTQTVLEVSPRRKSLVDSLDIAPPPLISSEFALTPVYASDGKLRFIQVQLKQISPVAVRIYSMGGQLVYQQNFNQLQKVEVEVGHFTPATYFVEVETADNHEVKKFIIK